MYVKIEKALLSYPQHIYAHMYTCVCGNYTIKEFEILNFLLLIKNMSSLKFLIFIHFCLFLGGFPGGGSDIKNLPKCRRPGLDPWVGKTPGEGNGNPPPPSTLAWKIPWTEEPGRL